MKYKKNNKNVRLEQALNKITIAKREMEEKVNKIWEEYYKVEK